MPTTPNNILTRLRAVNPAPVSPERAKEPTAQATLERILHDRGPEPASRSLQRPRRWLSAAPVVAATLVTLAVVGAALALLGRGRSPASGSRPPGSGIGALITHTPSRQLDRELRYVFAAMGSVQDSKACQVQHLSGATYVQGSPGPDLLSILGVLRRPATPADRFNPQGPIPDVYRAYIRRAFSAGGVTYYIVPSREDRAAMVPSDHCFALLNAAFNRYLPRIPASLRQPAREIQAAYIAYLRALGNGPQDRICLYAAGNGGGAMCGICGGATCGITAKGIEGGFATSNSLGTPGGTFSGVVPDGVATVTLELPAIGRQPAHAVTARVEGNVYAVHVSGLSRSQVSPTVIWRSPGGRVLKRMSTSVAANRALICKQSPVACLLFSALQGVSTSSSASSHSSPHRAG